MPSVNVSPRVSKPTHSLGFSWEGNIIGVNLEGGESSLVEAPTSPSPSPFQWKQTTWDGGRAEQRSINDQSAYYDSGSMWTLTPETLHPAQQWGHALGFLASDMYNPQSRSVLFKAIWGASQYVASSFVAGSSYNTNRIFLWIRAVGNPGTMTVAIYSNSAGAPNAVLRSTTITTAAMTDVLSVWQKFTITSQALVSGTTYWVVAFGAAADRQANHWEVGVDNSPAAFSSFGSDGSSWATATYRMYFRVAATPAKAQVFPFVYYGAQFAVHKYASGAASKLFINGDLGKASAATSTTITKTASGGISWTTDEAAGGVIRIVAGTGAGSEPRPIASNTSGTTPVFTVSVAWDVTPDTTSIFIVYVTEKWNEISSPATGLGAVNSAPAVGGQSVYFPQGSTAIRTMYFNETTGAYVWAADGTNTANFIRPLNDKMVKTIQSGQKIIASEAPFAAKGTPLVYVGSTPVGTLDYGVTSLCDYKNAMYALKQDGLYVILNGRATRINYGGDAIPDQKNGSISLSFQDSLFFSFLHSWERMTNATIDDIGWWRHEGMPDGRDGYASGATTFLSWIFVAVNATSNGSSTGISCVLCWNGRGWHEVFRAFTDGLRVTGIALQPSEGYRPRLWIFVENDAYYVVFPANAINPLQDSAMRYMHEGYVTTATIDLGKVNFKKIFKELLTQTKNLSDTAYIKFDYQVDNAIGTTGRDAWTPVEGGAEMNISPLANRNINLGAKTMIRLRARFYTENSLVPPILYALQVNGVVIEPPRYQWNATIKISTAKKNDFSGDAVVSFLRDAAQNMRLLQAHSTLNTLDSKWVYVSQPTVVRESYNFLTRKWTGRVVFTVREA